MEYYVGLDVSQKEVSICVVDGDGIVVAEGKVPTEASEILLWIEGQVGAVERIVHESGRVSAHIDPPEVHRFCFRRVSLPAVTPKDYCLNPHYI